MRNNDTDFLNNWDQLRQKKGKVSNGDKHLKHIWEGSSQYGGDFQPDVEAGLSKLKSRISQPQISSKRIIMRQWLRAAAAVFVIALASVAMFRHFGDSTSETAWIEIETSKNEKIQAILPDGSEVTLNENSHLSYASDMNTAEKRLVQMDGEVFFDVNRRPDQAFIISTSKSEIEVLGTSFNVRAYPNEAQTEVEVSTGRVAFRSSSKQQESILTAHEAAIISDNETQIKRISSPKLNRAAWKTGNLSFKDTEVQTAIPLIARYYDVEIYTQQKLQGGCPITGNWGDEPLDEVLNYIETFTDLKIVKISAREFQLEGVCE